MKFLIVTDQSWVEAKIPVIKGLLSLSPDLQDVTFDTRNVSLVPTVSDGRILEEWFQAAISDDAVTKGYAGAIFVASLAQGKKWKLKDGLRGSHFTDKDTFIECWAVSNKTSTLRFKDRTKRDRLPKVVAHELGHGLKALGYTDLEMHDYDFEDKINNIEGFYRAFRSLKKTNSLVAKLTEHVKALLARIAVLESKPSAAPSQRLYDTAYASIGKDMSPTDLAPDTLGCAESLNGVFETFSGKPILKNVVGTWTLLEQLKKDQRFKEVTTPLLGDIVMNASGTSTLGAKTGHCGIWGKTHVMSNNSHSGLWDAHYTHKEWKDYFEVKLGFPTRYFRPI